MACAIKSGSSADVGFCYQELNARDLIRVMSGYIGWKFIESSDTFVRTTRVEMCRCCHKTFSITVSKSKDRDRSFDLEVSGRKKAYTILNKREYGAARDIIKDRIRIESKEIEPTYPKYWKSPCQFVDSIQSERRLRQSLSEEPRSRRSLFEGQNNQICDLSCDN